MTDKERLLKRQAFLKKRNKTNNQILALMPPGNLSLFFSDNSFVWRVLPESTPGTKKANPITISKDNEPLAAEYSYKKFLTAQIACDKNELLAIDLYLNQIDLVTFEPFKSVYQHEYYRLLNKHTTPEREEWQKKLNKKYKLSTHRLQDRIVPTMRGELVRSKSEAMIADELFLQGFPYIYEPIIEIDGIKYAPDFMFVDMNTGAIYIWEHLGLMDDQGYRSRTYSKLQDFNKAGWIQGINMITTTETRSHPFTGQKARSALEQFL